MSPVMILGEICNFAGACFAKDVSLVAYMKYSAYAFVEALIVVCLYSLLITYNDCMRDLDQTPLGAISVVICAILSSLFLNEKLSFFGWLGCGLCIVCRSCLVSHCVPTHFSPARLGPRLLPWMVCQLCCWHKPLPDHFYRPARAIRGSDYTISENVSGAWVLVLHLCPLCHIIFYHVLLRAEVCILLFFPNTIPDFQHTDTARRACCGIYPCAVW